METAYDFFTNQNLDSFLRNYWIVVIVDLPRFLFGGMIVVFTILFTKHKGKTPRHLNAIGTQVLKDGISIIITLHNEGKSILHAVHSLNNVDIKDKNIIVINDV